MQNHKRVIALILAVFFALTLFVFPTQAAKKKPSSKKVKIAAKKRTTKKTIKKISKKPIKKIRKAKKKSRRTIKKAKKKVTAKAKIKKWTGPRPDFPVVDDTQKQTYTPVTPMTTTTLPAPPPPPVVTQKQPMNRGIFMPTIGSVGGTTALGVTFIGPLAGDANLGVTGLYGIGNKYTVMSLQGRLIFPVLTSSYVAVGGDVGSYSANVRNIPGISGTVTQGSHIGLGIAGGINLDPYKVEVGYSTALGLTAAVSYLF